MAPIPNNEMLDELAVDCMDLQSEIASEPDKNKHSDLIRKTLKKIIDSNKYDPLPEFEQGELSYNRSQ
jgi:hypothetical protein